MAKYGKTDPSVFQLRDMNRRITRIEKKYDAFILKNSIYRGKVASKLRSLRECSILVPVDEEE